MSYSKRRYCRPRKHKITKKKKIYFSPPLHDHYYVNSKIYKSILNHVGSLKIDKRDKLLKVNILSDVEWLFGVTPNETCSKKIMSYFIRNQIEDYKAVKK